MDAPRDGTPFSRADSAIGSDVTSSRATTNYNTPEAQDSSITPPGGELSVSSENIRGDSTGPEMAATTDEKKRKLSLTATEHHMEREKALRSLYAGSPQGLALALSYHNLRAPSNGPKASDESMSRESQIGSAEHPEVIEEEPEETLHQKVAKVMEVVGTTTEDAHDLLLKSCGDVQEAVGLFYERNSPNLIEEALSAMEIGKCSKTRKKFLRKGDVLIVLDSQNLSLSCRLRAEELRAASSWFEESLSTACPTSPGPEGVKYLYTLQTPAAVGGVPELVLRDLQALKRDCISFTRSKQEEGEVPGHSLSKKQSKKPVKKEEDDEAEVTISSESAKTTDWLKAYETFLRIISHTSPKHLLLDQDSINKSLSRIEAVSRLAHFYEANTSSSPVTSAFTVLFDGFDEQNMLWASIAGDAMRWLAIGANLKKTSIYKEAFVHVASLFPTLPNDLTHPGLSEPVRARIEHRSREMKYRRISVSNHLLSLSIKASSSREVPVSPSNDFLAYSVLVFYKEWIAEHLRFHESDTVQPQTSAFCNHEEHDCLQLAEFYRLLGGTDDYLPENQVFAAVTRRVSDGRRDSARDLEPEKKEAVRAALKTVKARVAEIVKPIITSTLRWTGKDSLPYLTSLVVEEEDYPWKAEVKREDSVTSEESEDDDTDMDD